MTGHILLVEDDANMREIIAQNLTKHGYTVTQAPGGEAAIKLLTHTRTTHHPYAVVISDILMNEIDGIEVISVARSQPYAPEVILLTGHGSLHTAIAALRVGAFDYLLKPCRISMLLERVADAIEHRKTRLRQSEEAQILGQITQVISKLGSQALPDKPGAAESDETSGVPDEPMLPDEADDIVQPAQEPQRYLTVGLLSIDTYRHAAWFGEQRLHLTPTEYTLLTCLAARSGRVVTYAHLTRYVYGNQMGDSESHDLLRWHVYNLRQKFDRRYLAGVRGVGYMLIDPNESSDGES